MRKIYARFVVCGSGAEYRIFVNAANARRVFLSRAKTGRRSSAAFLRRDRKFLLGMAWHLSCRYYLVLGEEGPMEIPLHVTFRNMEGSPAIEANIREKAAKLATLYDGILDCHVVVEAPHRHHRKGKSFNVRISLAVPGADLFINREPKRLKPAKPEPGELPEPALVEHHEPSKHAAHEDVYVAIRDAFNAAGRRLQEHVRRRRGHVKVHEGPPTAQISKLFPEEDYGFLETADGREVYFHRNAVLPPGFDHLELGAEVVFAEEMGEKGPQATSVRLSG
jgi:cold shock CspA family protein/ribosome-associated translation inhibitor RaiA